MRVGFLVFRILLPLLLMTIQFVLYVRTRNWLREKYPDRRWMIWVAAGLFLVFNAALLYVTIARPRQFADWFLYVGAYPFFLWHGSTLFIGVFVLVTLLLKLPFKILGGGLKLFHPTRKRMETLQIQPAYQRFDASRRTFLRRGMYTLTAASFGANAYGMLVGKKSHEVTEITFPIRNLPPQLHGMTIALLSDIHSSINMRKEDMTEYVAIANALQCDMALVTGDLVNSQTEEAYPFAEAFSDLSAPLGVYGVMGNHDFFAPDPDLVAKVIDDCGVKLLRNDKVVIEKNGGKLYLIGVDDVGNPARAEERFATAIGYAPLQIPKLLMVHRPYFLQQAADRDIDLVLSGHTHGGQVVLASFGNVIIAPASLASRYVWGKYHLGNTQMYVNRGIGTVALPIRLNCPPEITRITLVSHSTPS